jgi:hypothetical protein
MRSAIRSLFVPILVAGALGVAPSRAATSSLTPTQQGLYDVYKEMVETNTVHPHGNNTELAEKAALRLKAAGFTDNRVTDSTMGSRARSFTRPHGGAWRPSGRSAGRAPAREACPGDTTRVWAKPRTRVASRSGSAGWC